MSHVIFSRKWCLISNQMLCDGEIWDQVVCNGRTLSERDSQYVAVLSCKMRVVESHDTTFVICDVLCHCSIHMTCMTCSWKLLVVIGAHDRSPENSRTETVQCMNFGSLAKSTPLVFHFLAFKPKSNKKTKRRRKERTKKKGKWSIAVSKKQSNL